MVVDTRNHCGVDLGDGEALGGSGSGLQVVNTREAPLEAGEDLGEDKGGFREGVDTGEALLQAGVTELRSDDLNLQIVDIMEAPLEVDVDPSSDCCSRPVLAETLDTLGQSPLEE